MPVNERKLLEAQSAMKLFPFRKHLRLFSQSRSDLMTVAVDFSPRIAAGMSPVAERRLKRPGERLSPSSVAPRRDYPLDLTVD